MATVSQLCVANGVSVVSIEVLSSATTLKDFIEEKSATVAVEDKDAFFVVDLGQALHRHSMWKTSLPNIQPFYAVKCNEDPLLLKTLAALGTGFDCASKNEMKTVLELGVSPSRIIYANPCKQISHLKYAAKKGIELMTFDDELELYKVKKYFPSAKLVVRIRADCPDLVLQLGVKFGCSVPVAKNLLHIASSMGLAVVGVSFHVGSDCETPSSYLHALELAAEVFRHAAETGHNFTLLDIGGGFPGSKTKNDLFFKMVGCINQGMELFKQFPQLQVIAEPGRYFACATHAIAVNVIGKKILQSSETKPSKSFMYYVNDGVYGSFNGILYEHASPTPAVLKEVGPCKKFDASIWGPTCDGVDKIGFTVMPELEVGDWLYFDNMGAYSICAFSSFNGFPRPISYYYITESDSEKISSLLHGVPSVTVLEEAEPDGDKTQLVVVEAEADVMEELCIIPVDQHPHVLTVY